MTTMLRFLLLLLVATASGFAPQRQLPKWHQARARTVVASSADTDTINEGVQGTLGVLASGVMFFSLFTLKTTGCGLQAGPFGLEGFAEGISYLYVPGLGAYSLYKKVTTGSGLPAGPAGVLGAAEGLAFLAIVAGLVVLGFQLADYGFIPEALPTAGGQCSNI